MKLLDILAFGAHPDDTELSCSGTLVSLVNQSIKVGVIDLTRGEMGSRGSAEIRLKEAQEASDILGLHVRENLGLPDTELQNNRENQLPIIQVIRTYRPHVCILPAPSDRHPDHGDAAKLLIDAIFYSGLIKIETKDRKGLMQEPHRPSHIIHYIQDEFLKSDFIFDITDTIETKEKAIAAFSSQFNVKNPDEQPSTYISDPGFIESLRARAKLLGHIGGFNFGEGFIYHKKPFPVNNFKFLLDSSPKR